LKSLTKSNMEIILSKRLEFIEQLEKGLLDKEAFITLNYELVKSLGHVTTTIKSLEEGVVKYHYFNAMAKMKMLEADQVVFQNERQFQTLQEEAFSLYVKKDRITLQMLELEGFNQIDAYYINMNSKTLEGQIYEIKFNSLEKVVLHSRDRKILYKLRTSGCFHEEQMASVVDTYINTRVY
jgi:hypothetical protein